MLELVDAGGYQTMQVLLTTLSIPKTSGSNAMNQCRTNHTVLHGKHSHGVLNSLEEPPVPGNLVAVSGCYLCTVFESMRPTAVPTSELMTTTALAERMTTIPRHRIGCLFLIGHRETTVSVPVDNVRPSRTITSRAR